MRIWLLALILLSGCTTLNDKHCATANWRFVGKVDAQNGHPLSRQDQHQHICRAVSPINTEEYTLGWNEGLADYCTAGHAFQMGKTGWSYAPERCPQNQVAGVTEAFKNGREWLNKKTELASVTNKIQEQQEQARKDKSVVSDIAKAYYLLSGTSPTQELDEKAARLNEEVAALDARAPPRVRTSADEVNHQNTMSGIGAVVGTLTGFGIGHALQGRYRASGWKWTLGEVATLGTTFVVSHNECSTRASSEPNAEPTTCSSAWPSVAILGWLGFRVWQAVDLFTNDPRSQYGFWLLPDRVLVSRSF